MKINRKTLALLAAALAGGFDVSALQQHDNTRSDFGPPQGRYWNSLGHGQHVKENTRRKTRTAWLEEYRKTGISWNDFRSRGLEK